MTELDRVWPFLEPAAARVGTFGREHVETELASGRSTLWTSEDSAIVTTLRAMPNGERCLYGWLAGGRLEGPSGVLALLSRATEWARALGIRTAAVSCREGFKRPLGADGWRLRSVMLVKEL